MLNLENATDELMLILQRLIAMQQKNNCLCIKPVREIPAALHVDGKKIIKKDS